MTKITIGGGIRLATFSTYVFYSSLPTRISSPKKGPGCGEKDEGAVEGIFLHEFGKKTV